MFCYITLFKHFWVTLIWYFSDTLMAVGFAAAYAKSLKNQWLWNDCANCALSCVLTNHKAPSMLIESILHIPACDCDVMARNHFNTALQYNRNLFDVYQYQWRYGSQVNYPLKRLNYAKSHAGKKKFILVKWKRSEKSL